MGRKSRCHQFFFAAIVVIADSINAFLPIAYPYRGSNYVPPEVLSYSKDDNDINASELLKERLQRVRLEIMEEEIRRPPNPKFTAEQLIEEIMNGLLYPYDPLPDFGFRMMLRTATKDWRSAILHSIGANYDADLELAASALGVAIGRLPLKNQFSILVGEGEDYTLDFPSEPLDFDDGTCWVECRLRDKETSRLLVITGWNLRRREDGAWLVDSIDWQDFRDEFRPGIGREEWMKKAN
jgi:hypothetical protein